MTTAHKILFYPVGNGDTSQIILSGGRRILFDYCHRSIGEDDESSLIDLDARLKKELKDDGRDYFDVVAFMPSEFVCVVAESARRSLLNRELVYLN